MLKLRKFLCELFGLVAVVFCLVSVGTVPRILRFSQAHGSPRTIRSVIAVSLGELVLGRHPAQSLDW